MFKHIRTCLSHFCFIHAMVVLGLLALWGHIETNNKYMLLGIALSWAGAICGSFIRMIDSFAKDRSEPCVDENESAWIN